MGKCILIHKDGKETFQSDGSTVIYKKGKVTEDEIAKYHIIYKLLVSVFSNFAAVKAMKFK